ncbi:MAG: hypothetical protein AAF125_01375, partial [Chloroflexota bacterium]
DFVEGIVDLISSKYPSMYDDRNRNRWIGRENRVLMANDHTYLGISEYCGLAAVWLVAKADYNEPFPEQNPHLATAWMHRIEPGLRALLRPDLNKIGVMSNGVAIYRKEDRHETE